MWNLTQSPDAKYDWEKMDTWRSLALEQKWSYKGLNLENYFLGK